MMKIKTVPASRFGWQGTTLHYVVKADGATEVLVPKNGVGGLQARIARVRHVGDGVEAQVTVKVVDSSFY